MQQGAYLFPFRAGENLKRTHYPTWGVRGGWGDYCHRSQGCEGGRVHGEARGSGVATITLLYVGREGELMRKKGWGRISSVAPTCSSIAKETIAHAATLLSMKPWSTSRSAPTSPPYARVSGSPADSSSRATSSTVASLPPCPNMPELRARSLSLVEGEELWLTRSMMGRRES